MTDDQQHGQGRPQSGGRWDPLPQGDYDDGATAFVTLPEGGIDALLSGDSPLAAPGQGFVPPQIADAPGTDPAADGTGAWAMPAGGVEWPDAAATQAGQPSADDRFTYNPGATGQWTFDEPTAPEPSQVPGQDVTGQWSIPVAGGDLPDESGEFTTSSLIEQWSGGTPPATLPGGAPAPWAAGRPWGHEPAGTQPQGPAPGTGEHRAADPGTDEQHVARGYLGGEHGTAPGHPGGTSHAAEPRHGVASGASGAPHQADDPGQLGRPYYSGNPQHSGPRSAEGTAAHLGGSPPAPAAPEAPSYEPAPAAVEPVQRTSGAGESPGGAEEPQRAPGAADTAQGAANAAQGAVEAAVRHAARATTGITGIAGAVPGTAGVVGVAGIAGVDGLAGTAGTAEHQEPAPSNALAPGHAQAPAPDPAAEDARGPREDSETAPGAFEAAADEDTGVPHDEPGTAPAPEEATPPAASDDPSPVDTSDAPDTFATSDASATSDDAPPPHEEHPLASYVLRVNGSDRPVTEAWIGESLLYVLRERLGLAGAKDGCSQGECGACNVQVDGRLVASCLVPAVTTAGSEIRTVEGLAVDGQPSDVQRALARCGAVQCGFCVPGMAMTVHDLLEGNPAPTELETRQALCGNLCRCSGYRGVVEAVKEVVAEREAIAAADAEPDADGVRIPHQAGPGAGGVNPSAFEASHDQAYGQDGGQA